MNSSTRITEETIGRFKEELKHRGYSDLSDKISVGYLCNTLSKEDFWLLCKLDNEQKFSSIPRRRGLI